MADPLVQMTEASRWFGTGTGAVEALRSATCAIEPGQQIALLGPSGSGKSTLLHLIGGLDTPTSGTVAWPALGARAGLRPGKVVDVFQGPSLLPPLTVLDNVRLPLVLQGAGDREATAGALAALETFGLPDLRDKLPEEISGGQSQRVALARALVVRPRLVLADEPTGQLDSATALAVLETFLAALRDIGAALLLSTHDQRVAARFPTRWVMRNGRLDTAGGDAPLGDPAEPAATDAGTPHQATIGGVR